MAERMEDQDGNVPDSPEYGRAGRVLLDTVAEAILNTTIFVFRFIAWAFRWSVATVVMLIVMAAAGLFVFNQAVVGGEPVRVPNIQNLDLREARDTLFEHGLDMGTPALVESAEVAPNIVLSQRPKAGDVVRSGRKVYPSVSRGVQVMDAPDLVSKTMEEASQIIEEAGLRVAQPAYIPHAAMRETVIGQDPPPGVAIKDGEINLLVSSGANSGLIMPRLVGLDLPEVADKLARLGVTGRPIQVDEPDSPVDVVLDQRPQAGSIITPGMVVEYSIRPSEEMAEQEEMLHRVEIPVTVPGSGVHRFRAEGIWKDGTKKELMAERALQSGSVVTIPFYFSEEATLVVYIDGLKYRSYYCEGDSPYVVTNHTEWSANGPAPA